jgi:hypothetical protein
MYGAAAGWTTDIVSGKQQLCGVRMGGSGFKQPKPTEGLVRRASMVSGASVSEKLHKLILLFLCCRPLWYDYLKSVVFLGTYRRAEGILAVQYVRVCQA